MSRFNTQIHLTPRSASNTLSGLLCKDWRDGKGQEDAFCPRRAPATVFQGYCHQGIRCAPVRVLLRQPEVPFPRSKPVNVVCSVPPIRLGTHRPCPKNSKRHEDAMCPQLGNPQNGTRFRSGTLRSPENGRATLMGTAPPFCRTAIAFSVFSPILVIPETPVLLT